MRLFGFALLALNLCLGTEVASASSSLESLFVYHFHNVYQARQCGTNILKFVEAIEKQNGAVDNMRIVYIENKGFSYFGLLNAERGRSQRFEKPFVDEVNWYHHVIAVNEEGWVYDFDYGIEPRIVHISEYLESMFLNENECSQSTASEPCIGRERKMADYQLEAVSAKEALARGSDLKQVTMTLGEVIENWRKLIQGGSI